MRYTTIAWIFLLLCAVRPHTTEAQEVASHAFKEEVFTEHSAAGDASASPSAAQGVHVLTLRNPSFGNFYCGPGGGKIIVHQDGSRTCEGDIILMNSGVSIAPALFEVSCEPFIMLQIFSDITFSLYGENGEEMNARIISTNPPFPHVTAANAAQGFTVAATVCLEIAPGQNLLPGNYNGSFQLNCIAE